MSLNQTDVTRIAHLAHLELSAEQAGNTLEQLNGIFALVEKMQAIDTSGIEPLSHPFALVVDQLALRRIFHQGIQDWVEEVGGLHHQAVHRGSR